MRKGKVVNILLVLVVIVLLGIFAFSVHIRPTADQVAVVRVEGINCGGAVADIEKALQAKKGVAAVEVNTYDGRVVVGYDSKTIQSEAIASSIAGLGYAVYAAEALSLDRFRAMTGREPGAAPGSVGCGGACGVRR